MTRLIQQYSDLELASRMQLEELLGITIELAKGCDLQQDKSTSGIESGEDFRYDALFRAPQLDQGEGRRSQMDRVRDCDLNDILNDCQDHQTANIGVDDSWDSKKEDFRPSVPPLISEFEDLQQMPGSRSDYPDPLPQQPRVDNLHHGGDFPSEEASEEFDSISLADAISEHDEKFARFLSSLPDSEWDVRGRLLDDPFQFPPDHAANRTLKGKACLFDDEGSSTPTYLSCEKLWSITPETCKICFDAEITFDNSHCVNDKCNHRFCTVCLRQHAETVIKSSDKWEIPCPEVGCAESFSMELCESMLPVDALDQIAQRQVENVISNWERVYCPYEDCSFLQLRPDVPEPAEPSGSQRAAIGAVECLSCHRLFCLECQVPWHSNLTCEEYECFSDDEKSDLLLIRGLAKDNNWQRCACGHLVERNQGCNHMKCRCGKEFCYICGDAWSHHHTCQGKA
ncbi:hypothetical protein R1flu_000220 [Riccia fluitans]|uniref:RBR-type E3 ubiquitin transferase n=1 Tax=Riccia fluitans TaxID=41844 RepID=A0ABD1Y096_9MARC